MSGYTITVGNVELVSLTDGQGDGHPVEVFPASTMEQWRKEYPELLDADERIHPRYGALAVRSSGKLIVVDTGAGPPDGRLPDEMRRKGMDPEDVEIVVTTHLHSDHVGWNLTDGRPTFPNARYLVPKADWEYWTGLSMPETPRHVAEQVTPLERLHVMDLIDGEHTITNELTAIPTPGHTPGHISIAILSGGKRGFILGDVAHSSAQAHYTDWSPSFDTDPDRARKTRHRVLDMLEADGTPVSAGHMPEPGFGRFFRRDGRRIWQPL